MNPENLLKSIYLGDRTCKALLIDSWNQRVEIQVDIISRLRPGTQAWDFYAERDIKDGRLVFRDVRNIRFEPSGPLPNDYIIDVSVSEIGAPGDSVNYAFGISVGSVDSAGNSTEVHLRIEASGLHLEDPLNPGVEIRD